MKQNYNKIGKKMIVNSLLEFLPHTIKDTSLLTIKKEIFFEVKLIKQNYSKTFIEYIHYIIIK